MSRIRQLITFMGIFAFILVLSHAYMFMRISYYLQLTDRQQIFVALALGGFSLLTLIVLPLSRQLPRKIASVLSWIAYPWMGLALLLFVTLLITDIAWSLLNLVAIRNLPEPTLLLQYCFGIVALTVTGLLGLFSVWKALGPVRVKPVTITLKPLPPSMDGLRIVQVTDIHIGPLINGRWLQRVVNKINDLQPDLIVITGDLVDGSVEELRSHVAPLAGLTATHGTYFVTGNHEYYSGAEEWCAYIGELGIRVLRNEHVSITTEDGTSFNLAGVDDWSTRHYPHTGHNMSKAVTGHGPQTTLILLAHQPASAHEAARHGVDLQLSGHTHGGQIWPFNYLVKMQQPYTKGLHRHRDTDMQIYISTGTGFWGPPMRLGTTAEITHITLRSASEDQ